MLLEEIAKEILNQVKLYASYGSNNFGENKKALDLFKHHYCKDNPENFLSLIIGKSKDHFLEKKVFLQGYIVGTFTKNIEPVISDFFFNGLSEADFKVRALRVINVPPDLFTPVEAAGLRACIADAKKKSETSFVETFIPGQAKEADILESARLTALYGFANCGAMAHLAYALAQRLNLQEKITLKLWYLDDIPSYEKEELNFITLSSDNEHIIVIPWSGNYFQISASTEQLEAEIKSKLIEIDSNYQNMLLMLMFEKQLSPENAEERKKALSHFSQVLNSEERQKKHQEIEAEYCKYMRLKGAPDQQKNPYGPYARIGIFPFKATLKESSEATKGDSVVTQFKKMQI